LPNQRIPRIFPNPDALSAGAARRFVELATASIAARGRFAVALSGGSTPKRLYQLLASPNFIDRIDWSNIDFFFGDERCVALDHPDSNFRMAQQALFAHGGAQGARVFPVAADCSPDQAAEKYAEQVAQNVPSKNGFPQFDLVFLGVGADGHTASLFPGTSALDVIDRTAVAVYAQEKGNWRVTLTFPTLNNAAHTVVLLEGAPKAGIVARLCSNAPPAGWPIERITPRNAVEWYMDEAAAGTK